MKARWITSKKTVEGAAVTFQKKAVAAKPVKKATAKVTAAGTYAFFINGNRIGKGVLAPGWTSYANRIQYQTYDVTEFVRDDFCMEIHVGPGWLLNGPYKAHNIDPMVSYPAAIARITITYEDGSKETIVTDSTWDAYTNEVTFSHIYHGETVDKTAPIRSLGKVEITRIPTKLIPQEGEWIVENERLAPIELIRTPKGELVLDFGQNLTGYVEIRIKGPRGSRIVLHHGEVLDKDGNFYNENMRAARNENVYVLSGGADIFKPTYTFQGFRYVRLTEYPLDEVCFNDFRAIVVHSEMKRTGSFVCGNEKINQLYHNIVWGQKCNYLDVPTDCPQRDERLGWTGDTQVFCRTAAINFDVERFFIKWLNDVALDQGEDGLIPHVVPSMGTWGGAAGWGDVACIAPWQMYLAYGNRKVLKKQFPMMKKWVEFIRNFGDEELLWLGQDHFGDWLAMDGDPDSLYGMTPTDFIACAYYVYSTGILIQAGEVVGEDVQEYRELYPRVRQAFRARYIKNGKLNLVPNGWKEGDEDATLETQTAYTMLLFFDLLEEDEKASFAARLAQMIRENGTRMTTGFLGTPYLLHALSGAGYVDLAYELLMQEKTPSWLYSVNHGATTMWEHWNSLKEDGSFWSTSMNSFNHYAYGAVFDWIFGVAAGIVPMSQSPAYKEIVLEPHPNRCLGFADTAIHSRSGYIRSYWYYKGDTVYYEFEIPQGVTAHLRLPSGYTETLNGGIYHFAE